MPTLKEWNEFLDRKGFLNEQNRQDVLSYIDILNKAKLPVIFDLDHLSLLLGLNKEYLASVINSPKNHWRSFRLKKRSGGFRDISVPYPTLLYVQRWIYNNILVKIAVSPYCHGFKPGRSIITNASWHLDKSQLLKIDLADFFPSIGINRVIALFKEIGYTHKVSFYLAAMCCLEGRLPQGAPTSPYLSNLIARPLDYRMMKLAKKHNLNYTRYADDMTFSGEEINCKFKYGLTEIIQEEGFSINESKTRHYKKVGKRIVTGLNVTDRLCVPRDFKRKIRQEVHYIKKYGLIDHMEKSKCQKKKYCRSLLGRICFWLQVEPENQFAINAKKHILWLSRTGFDYI